MRRAVGSALGAALAVVAAGVLAAPAGGHEAAPKVVRELVRLQGYLAPAPAGVPVQRELMVTVLGQSLRFAAETWRRFGLADAAATPEPDPAAVTLQGDRAELRKVATARAGQQVTILAERRSGGTDLFVLAVDRCPRD